MERCMIRRRLAKSILFIGYLILNIEYLRGPGTVVIRHSQIFNIQQEIFNIQGCPGRYFSVNFASCDVDAIGAVSAVSLAVKSPLRPFGTLHAYEQTPPQP
jgi:hypothetical protein